MKKLFRPSTFKFILTAGLFGASTALWHRFHIVHDASFYGFPLAFVEQDGFCGPASLSSDCGKLIFYWNGTLFDVLFWYGVSSALIRISAIAQSYFNQK